MRRTAAAGTCAGQECPRHVIAPGASSARPMDAAHRVHLERSGEGRCPLPRSAHGAGSAESRSPEWTSDHLSMVNIGRSPWTGLTPAQSLTLADELTRPENIGRERAEVLWDVHTTFSRRAAVALGSNDLRAALDAAEVACVALRLWQRERAPDVEGEGQPVIDQDPAATLRAEARSSSWPAHGPDRPFTGRADPVERRRRGA
jgi:hypothetical protein